MFRGLTLAAAAFLISLTAAAQTAIEALKLAIQLVESAVILRRTGVGDGFQ